MKKVDIYTDGACSGNPGAGGWGVVLIYGKHIKELSGFDKLTTNNRMELFAVIMGLKALKENCEINIFTDSAYVFNAFDKNWIGNWQQNGWKNAEKKDIFNKDLWLELVELCNTHKVNWNKVKGHSDNKWNNKCDELATGQIKTNKKNEE